MPRITLYVVQCFGDSIHGLVAEEPIECRSAGDAKFRAQSPAPITEGVVAWAKSGDPDTGQWDDDPEILFQAGRTE